MTAYRRLRLPGATYFFTVRLQRPGSTLLTDHIDQLRWAYATTVAEEPVTCHAMVILPDHLHAIWQEPDGQVRYSERWRKIKARFTHAIGGDHAPNDSKVRRREAGLWQRRFWEHAIRDARDMANAMDYCRMNPVEHGLVTDPVDWPYSSFNRAKGQAERRSVSADAAPQPILSAASHPTRMDGAFVLPPGKVGNTLASAT